MRKEVSEQFEQRLNLQSNRIDVIYEYVNQSRKTAEENAELLQNLLVGVENMRDNLKKFREEMERWKSTELQDAERDFEETTQELI